MEPHALFDALCELARAAGIELRALPAATAGEAEPSPRSGACVLRGRRLVLLAPGDSLEDRIEALLDAIAACDPAWLEGQWLPPALRERLERAAARRPKP